MVNLNLNSKIITNKNLETIDYSSIMNYPMYAFESSIKKTVSLFNNSTNFKAVVKENDFFKYQVFYKNSPIEWGKRDVCYKNDILSGAALIFPRQDCYDIPVADLQKIPVMIAGVEGTIKRVYYTYFFPTFRFFPSNLILVDLGILGPSANCPDNKYEAYWDFQKSYLEKIQNTLTSEFITPQDYNWYYLETVTAKHLVTNSGNMLLFSFLIQNKFSLFGDLRLFIDNMMNDCDKEILKNI